MLLRGQASCLEPDERCEQILRVASLHFSRQSYDAASMQAIATEAGISRALIYHYFPNKESLFGAVLRREADALLAATAPDPRRSPQRNLLRALSAYLDHFCSSSGELRNLYAEGASAPSLVRELVANNHAILILRILNHLGQKDTPVLRLAISAWLAFVTEAARQLVRLTPQSPKSFSCASKPSALSAAEI